MSEDIPANITRMDQLLENLTRMVGSLEDLALRQALVIKEIKARLGRKEDV